jgi:L-2-hydroxyglutarate oxidase LhgO
MGGKLILGAEVTDISDSKVLTTNGEFSYGHVVNASGLYADKVAKLMGFSENHELIPFAGVYFDVPELKGKLSRQIYPVPDLRLPFLGVHFTAGFGGDVKLGPSAIPLLSREQYSTFKGWDALEFFEISQNLWRFFLRPSNKAMALAKSEIMHLSKNRIIFEAQKLLKSSVKIGDIKRKSRIGIRAQLISKMNGRLEQDFLIEGDSKSTHILNVVSPGWTSCFSFAKHVLSLLEEKGQF